MNPFSTLKLSEAMLSNLKKLKYQTMTSIQEKSIPLIMRGDDILAQAKTGSGKTAAFGIGLLHNLDFARYRIQALVLCPTRELAEQVSGELRRLAKFQHNIKILTITGGLPMYRQELSLKHLAHIVVGTPGRILKLLQRKSFHLNELKMLVLDEADRMLDMGFIDQIKDVIAFAPQKRQTLCFSATYPDEITAFSRSILKKPEKVAVETQHDERTILQHFCICKSQEKTDRVIDLLKAYTPESSLIFCNTKDACRKLAETLKNRGVDIVAIHGDLEQKEREEVLIRFSNGSIRVLAATDVAARGLDIDALGAVINYDMPFDTETYVHRTGRTGRAGSDGLAFSLLMPNEQFRLDAINEYLNTNFNTEFFKTTENIHNQPMGKLIPEMITLSVNGGRKNKISAGDILGVLTANDIHTNDIGKIDRTDFITFVAIKRKVSRRALYVLNNKKIKGKNFKAKMHV